jgi:hypothetical protein
LNKIFGPDGRLLDSDPVRKPSGFLLVDGQVVADTVQCPHCGTHFTMVRGSGTRRGFCTKCMGVTCGRLTCNTDCIPKEKRLDLREKQGK